MCAGGDVCAFADMYTNIQRFENVDICLYMCMYVHVYIYIYCVYMLMYMKDVPIPCVLLEGRKMAPLKDVRILAHLSERRAN